MKEFSSLSRLFRIIAWVWRPGEKWLERKGRPRGKSKWEAVSLKEKAKETVLTVDELENTLRDLFLECVTFPFPETTLSRLAVYTDMDSWFVEAGFRC